MNGFDQQKAARVWQRVQQSQPRGKQYQERQPERLEELPEWLMNEWTAAATYRQLAAGTKGPAGAMLRQLAQQEQKHGTCLSGIHALTTGEKYRIQTPKIGREPLERTLRRCYGMHLRNLRAYESKIDDPEYGPVFSELARQEQGHCVTVLELLGVTNNNGG